jgi:cell division protein FtsB
MKKFAFRQRIGAVNWKIISSVDLERVIDECNVEELQVALDAVTFCDFTSSEVKRNSVESITNLVSLMQFMLEYMLYCQESQLQLVLQLRKRNEALKAHDKELSQRNTSLKEDVKIYQKQLAMLRESLSKYQTSFPNRRIVTKENDNRDNHENPGAIVESILRHERETRQHVHDMLEQQRAAFLQELSAFSTKSNTPSTNVAAIQSQLDEYMAKILSQLSNIQINNQLNNSNNDEMNEINYNKKLNKLRNREMMLDDREKGLEQWEDSLRNLEHELNHKQQQLESQKNNWLEEQENSRRQLSKLNVSNDIIVKSSSDNPSVTSESTAVRSLVTANNNSKNSANRKTINDDYALRVRGVINLRSFLQKKGILQYIFVY